MEKDSTKGLNSMTHSLTTNEQETFAKEIASAKKVKANLHSFTTKSNRTNKSLNEKKEQSIIWKVTKDSMTQSRKRRRVRTKEEKIKFLTQSIQTNESKLRDLEQKQKKLELESSGIINYKKLQKSSCN